MKYLVLFLAWIGLMTTPALAQDASAIDLTPIIEHVLAVIAAVLGVIATWAAAWFKKKTQIDVEAMLGANFQNGVQKGIDYAVNMAREQATASGLSQIQVKNELIRMAAGYALAAYPSAAQQLGLSPENVRNLVRARLMPETVAMVHDEANGDPNMLAEG